MFCAFAEPPKILRLYGRASTHRPGDSQWPELNTLFPDLPGIRQIVVANITRVQTSCGFGVPIMQLVTQRDQLTKWAQKKGLEGLADYQERKNRTSIDGLPAYPTHS
jgi:hypothetical protein